RRGHLVRRAGVHQYGRVPGPAAHQGADIASYELWRLGRGDEPLRTGPDAARGHRKPHHDARRPHMNAPTVLIMAGGTGGHIMPGLAVADVLRERGWRVLWLGNPDKMEGRLVPPRGIDLVPMHFQGVRGRGVAAMLKLPFLLLRACSQAWKDLTGVRPDVVLGMGGYVAFPGGMMAVLRGLPLVVHEQNAVAGTANRWLARLARRVLSGFPDVLPRGEVLGNPVRRDVCALPGPAERYAGRTGPLRMLVVGG